MHERPYDKRSQPLYVEPDPLAVELALDLMKLGVSTAGVQDLLANYDHEAIRRQLEYLPFRNAKRPGAFIVEAIRHDYSPPKELYYAHDQAHGTGEAGALDEDPE